ncbi:hypothetical protein [Halomicrobium salinisoli]|uniref:hypothetical protein n=1 Tax=Halomicrobium salinisoli TaxID=2878391 RepID=UPI001CF077FA|nr:hypothetical protein [Halomicrobium salinisoli]
MSKLFALPQQLLGPLKQLAALVQEYGSLPRAIFALISTYIVASVLNLGAFAVNSVLGVFNWITGSIDVVRVTLVYWFGRAGIDVLGVIRAVQQEAAAAVATLGPLGPPVVIGVGALVIYGLYRLLVAAAGTIPGVSIAVDLLGLR